MTKPASTNNDDKNIDKNATPATLDTMQTPAELSAAVAAGKMTEKEAKEAKEAREKLIRDTNNAEMKAAKATLKAFSTTKEYGKLTTDVQAAITRVIGKAAFGGGATRTNTFADSTMEMFGEVGTSISELAIFKKTKMGRSEFRKRVREALKKADPAARRWIEFNETTEEWTLHAIGAAQPTEFKGKAIDEPKEATPATDDASVADKDATPAKDKGKNGK